MKNLSAFVLALALPFAAAAQEAPKIVMPKSMATQAANACGECRKKASTDASTCDAAAKKDDDKAKCLKSFTDANAACETGACKESAAAAPKK